ncbi:PREDICTED: uncharacterized protein LOC108781995 isoform X2 [Cyphomyrmex costatus]|uniref:uncharacterized protein LOC108781995 isoform X2 n=1 Tax=Cyphomyrmex costatus TaxID=456900 RepID=UPI0008522BCD|nr:PREDICTED: uncharacterized protein LOC108781995 isoform X2 [Cyphomyrmex costatus]
MTSMSYQYLVRVTTVCNIIRETCEAIWNSAIDGKHVTIQCPNNAGSTYYNYKHAHSVVLMAICDAHYVFHFVDIGAYGRRSDGSIFNNSTIGKNFNTNSMNTPKPSAVAGG